MTADEIRAAVRRLGWSQRDLAGRLKINRTTVRRWLSGDRTIPPHLADWLRGCVEDAEASDGAWAASEVAAMEQRARGTLADG